MQSLPPRADLCWKLKIVGGTGGQPSNQSTVMFFHQIVLHEKFQIPARTSIVESSVGQDAQPITKHGRNLPSINTKESK
jgi:hypothetical protein